MGQKKLIAELKAGRITKAQYNERLAQSASDKKVAPKAKSSTKTMVKQVARPQPRTFIPKVPLPEKAVMTKPAVDLSDQNVLLAYLKCLNDPEDYKSRYPDSFSRPTALFRSVAEYSVPIAYDGTANSGQFSLCVQPKFGSTAFTDPTTFQVAMANVTPANWPTADWSVATNFLGSTTQGDPRLDPNFYYMQGTTGGFSAFKSADITTNAIGTQGLQPLFNMAALNNNNFGPQPTFTINANGASQLNLPPGTWSVTLTAVGKDTASSVNPYAFSFAQDVAIPNTATLVQTNMSNGSFETTLNAADTFVASINSILSAPMSGGFTRVRLLDGNGNAAANAGLGSTTFVYCFITPAQTSANNAGFIERLRPVAQSTLVSYMGPELLDGGQITMAYVDPDWLSSNYFKKATFGVQGQDVNALATLNDNVYNGRLATGAYGWWSPTTNQDMTFTTISTNAASLLPGIVCSGSFTPATTIAGSVNNLVRLRVCTVWEFWTESTAWDVEKCLGSQAIIDAVNNILQDQPKVMPNGKHLEYIKRLFKQSYQFVRDNPGLFLKIGSALGSLASAL
jgi:hypothetical protein